MGEDRGLHRDERVTKERSPNVKPKYECEKKTKKPSGRFLVSKKVKAHPSESESESESDENGQKGIWKMEMEVNSFCFSKFIEMIKGYNKVCFQRFQPFYFYFCFTSSAGIWN